MTDVVIVSAARTAIGSYGKSLVSVPPSDLGATAAKAVIERAGIEPSDVDHVVFGNVIHTEPADAYMARVVADEGRCPEGGTRLHRQPAVRNRRAGDRLRSPGDPDRRSARGARRRRRVDEPRTVLAAGRSLGCSDGRRAE